MKLRILLTRKEAVRRLRAIPPPQRKAIRQLADVFTASLKSEGDNSK